MRSLEPIARFFRKHHIRPRRPGCNPKARAPHGTLLSQRSCPKEVVPKKLSQRSYPKEAVPKNEHSAARCFVEAARREFQRGLDLVAADRLLFDDFLDRHAGPGGGCGQGSAIFVSPKYQGRLSLDITCGRRARPIKTSSFFWLTFIETGIGYQAPLLSMGFAGREARFRRPMPSRLRGSARHYPGQG